MSRPPPIRVENVSKKFARSLKRAMIYGLADIARLALIPRRFQSPHFEARLKDSADGARVVGATSDPDPRIPQPAILPPLRPTEFWAVQNVSFEIQRGECLGIIGHNGAGKSTIFKMLSGIYGPTIGHIEQRGTLSALIEVGSGFHPMLSGRENIYIAGAIRGMSTEEIDRKYEKIVEFSGVGEFIEMPIKFYSSGMHVRLGFAVLAFLEPDILLIDEILAVGDLAFQKQCIEHINKLRESDMAIALISHSLYRIESLCHRAIWMDHGQVKLIGTSKDVIKAYRDHEVKKQLAATPSVASGVASDGEKVLYNSDNITIHGVETLHEDGRTGREFAFGEDFRVRLSYTAKQRIHRPRFNYSFQLEGTTVFTVGMLLDGKSPEFVEGPGVIECIVRNRGLLPRKYDILLYGTTSEGAVYIVEPSIAASFTITAEGLERLGLEGPYSQTIMLQEGIIACEYTWDLRRAISR
jgi:ABC-type polysaccharide/polyol phosphate transport system ATPase subunit